MSEENKMTEENKKTIIAFIAGLLVGGLLVFIFVNPATDTANELDEENDEVASGEVTFVSGDEEDEDNNDEPVSSNNNSNNNSATDTTNVTDGSITVADQDAGDRVYFTNAEFPANEGWVGVREYENGQLIGLLGVSRWSDATGLSPTSVGLLRSTEAGQTYAIVFYSENGDGVFSLATDAQMGGVMGTFKAE